MTPAFIPALPLLSRRTAPLYSQTSPRPITFKRPSRVLPSIHLRPTYHQPILAFDQSLDDGIDEQSIIRLHDDNGRTLSCGVEQYVEHSDQTYALCYPIDDAVIIARSERDNLVPIEDHTLIQKLFPDAQAVLSEDNIQLQNTPYFLTIDDFGEDEETTDSDSENHQDDNNDDDDDETEQIEVLAQFLHQGQEYLITRPLYPVLLVARQTEQGFSVVQGDDLHQLTPIIDAVLDAAIEQQTS